MASNKKKRKRYKSKNKRNIQEIKREQEEIEQILEKLEKKKGKKEKKSRKKKKKEPSIPAKKQKKKIPAGSDFYFQSNRLRINYSDEFNPYLFGNSLDYDKLYSHMGKPGKDPYQQFLDSMKAAGRDELGDRNILTEEELERIIKTEMTTHFLGGVLERSPMEEREKYKHWKQFNFLMNMIKIDMMGLGYGAVAVNFY